MLGALNKLIAASSHFSGTDLINNNFAAHINIKMINSNNNIEVAFI